MIYEAEWLRRGGVWLTPSRCDCGAQRSVIWTAWNDREGYADKWGVMCVPCRLALFQADDSNHTCVVHGRTTALRAAGRREVPEVHVWTRPGCVVAADRLASVISSFATLERARAASTRIPQAAWAVEIRDGEPWAPWDPTTGVYKRGPDLPLRRVTLRKSRRERTCRACKSVLTAGSTAWVPTERPRLASDGGPATIKDGQWMATWDGRAMATIKVCAACVSGARVIEADEPGVMVGHLRVVTGMRADESG